MRLSLVRAAYQFIRHWEQPKTPSILCSPLWLQNNAASIQSSRLPKKPRSSYMIFSVEKFDSLRKANPGVKVPDLGRMMGQMWRILPDAEKDVYKQRSAEEREVVAKTRKAELEKMSAMEREEMAMAARLAKKKRAELRLKRKAKKLNKPTPTKVNPYIIYFQSRMGERGSMPLKDFVGIVSEGYKSLSDAQKQPYKDEAARNSLAYKRALEEWTKKMIAEGHSDVLNPEKVKKLKSGARATKRASAVGKTTRRKKSAKSYEEDSDSGDEEPLITVTKRKLTKK